ncbi:MAG: HAMP domain-containing protein, partial [Caldilinea sp.]|nr:HAMP domain-containing protein [Caldilinea sp.]
MQQTTASLQPNAESVHTTPARPPFSRQSLWRTGSDRWRYLLGVLAGMVLIVTLLLWYVTAGERSLAELAVAGGLAVIAAAALLMGALDVSSWRVRQITAAVERIAAGDLDARVPARGPGDIGALSRAVNGMAERLERQSRKRNRERDRLNTV